MNALALAKGTLVHDVGAGTKRMSALHLTASVSRFATSSPLHLNGQRVWNSIMSKSLTVAERKAIEGTNDEQDTQYYEQLTEIFSVGRRPCSLPCEILGWH